MELFSYQIATSVKRSEKQLPSKSNFRTFCHSIALILGWNSVKGLRVIKYVKEIKFEGVWGELESKKVSRDNNSQNIWD